MSDINVIMQKLKGYSFPYYFTANQKAMDITPFRNILNEMYAADISVKVKSALRIRHSQGKFIGTSAPYGYLKDPNDHNHLVVDAKVAPIVKKIFQLALDGNGTAKIRHYLIDNKILRPAAYAAEKGVAGYERYVGEEKNAPWFWSENGVRLILRNPVYVGDLPINKRPKLNMKSKKRLYSPVEEWEVIENTHEGIVSREVFNTVQEIMTSRRHDKGELGFDNIFAGVLKCADCGYQMRISAANRRKRPELIDCIVYTCNNYGRYGNKVCTAHSIEARDLYDAVLERINYYAELCSKPTEAKKKLFALLYKEQKEIYRELDAELKKVKKRLSELDGIFMTLYEDRVNGNITERNYTMMSGKYSNEQNQLYSRIEEIEKQMMSNTETEVNVDTFVAEFQKYGKIEKLTSKIIHETIETIYVSEKEKNDDGEVTQHIKIVFKHVGEIPNDLHIKPTARKCVCAPKICARCGVAFTPLSNVAKYCDVCRIDVHKQQALEANIRRSLRRRSLKND